MAGPALLALAEEHIPHFVAASADWRELAAYGPPYWRPRSSAELRRKLAATAGPTLASEYTFAVEMHGDVLGECSVHAIDHRNRVGQVGVCIWDPADRGRGLGSRALRELMDWAIGYLGLLRLEAWIVEGNTASLTMATRLGFVHEGTMRQRYLCGGRWHDVQLLAYLAPGGER